MFYFEPTVQRVEDEAEPGHRRRPAGTGVALDEPGPLRLRLATDEAEPEPAGSLDVPELYIYPPPIESIELRFSAIRYDLEARGGKAPGHLKI